MELAKASTDELIAALEERGYQVTRSVVWAQRLAQGQARREAILRFLAAYGAEHGYAPTHREIREAVGLGSPTSLRAHLRVLEEEGYIRTGDRYLPRAIVLLRTADGAPVRWLVEQPVAAVGGSGVS